MELTAAVFRHQEDDLDQRQKFAVKAAMGDGRIGLLPGCEYLCQGMFVGRTYEITNFKCTALLPSGTILQVEEDLQIEIPKLPAGSYFICVGMSDTEIHEFTKDGIPYQRPAIRLMIQNELELGTNDFLPVKHFMVTDGKLNMDYDYTPPCISFTGDERISQFIKSYSQLLLKIIQHANLEDGDGKRSLLHLFFRLNTLSENRWDTRDLLDLLNEIAQAIDYYLVDKFLTEIPEMPQQVTELRADERRLYNQYNQSAYFKWLENYLSAQESLLDLVVIIDTTIDYDKLKAELRKELYDQIYPEVYTKLQETLHAQLTEQLTNMTLKQIRIKLEELKPIIAEELHVQLHDPLYEKLLEELYQKLYDALYRPAEEEIEFIPLI